MAFKRLKAIWVNTSCRWPVKNPLTSWCPPFTKPKSKLSELFHKIFGTELTDDVDKLTGFARMALRDIYRTADVGLSGVNFAVAETWHVVFGRKWRQWTFDNQRTACSHRDYRHWESSRQINRRSAVIQPIATHRNWSKHHNLFQHDYRSTP